MYIIFQIIVILSSIIATTSAGIDLIPRPGVAIISAVTAIFATILSTFKIKEKNYSYSQVITGIELEKHKYDNKVGEYFDLSDHKAYDIFGERISEIKKQYADQELSFWSPSEKSIKEEKHQKATPVVEEDKCEEKGR
jgi:hypothetical protein